MWAQVFDNLEGLGANNQEEIQCLNPDLYEYYTLKHQLELDFLEGERNDGDQLTM